MDNKKNGIPKLRFPGFTGAWEQRKLGEVVNLRGRIGFRGYKQTDLVDKGQGAISFSPADIDEFGNVLNCNNKYISWAKYDESPEIQIAQGDILFTKTASIGKIGYITKLREKATINPQIALITPLKNENGYFIFLSLRLDQFTKKVRNIIGGSSVPTLSQEKLKLLTFMYPDTSEQKEIGDFFKQLDSLIALHQRKLEHLQEQKKGLLQKMFPKNGENVPEVRFPGFTDAWEQRKLEEITSVITKGTTPLDKSGKGSINFVKVEDLSPDNSGINVHSMISKEEHEGRLKRSILKENDILFSIAGTLGRIGIVKSEILPANTNQALAIVRLKEGNLSYISTVLEGRTVREYIRQNPTVGAQPNLSLKQVSELRISFPTLQEQEQVGNFFNKLNSFIALHQRKLEHLELMKKGLLQQMFV